VKRLQTTQGVLARRGFTDSVAAERIVADWDEVCEDILQLVTRAADPDLALQGLDRLCDAQPGLLARLCDAPVLARQLVQTVGASAALLQHLVAHPEQIDLLTDELVRRPAAELRAELLTAVGADARADVPVASGGLGDQLRIAYRGALLRIAARDLCAPEPIEVLEDVAAELADLADATLEAALALARHRYDPLARQVRLAVVGLGKCGAQELNYVSDVDVIFVAEPVCDDRGEPLTSLDTAITVATRMAAEMSRICSAHTSAGTIWEVDAALRPEGKAGQLVRTLSSHQTYYSRWAKTWEFQAMLKARPSAGDLGLGQAFVDMVSPLVWKAAEREHFVADAQAMRKRVVAHIPARQADRELKLGEGGLRDVEFSVQLLQLVHGRVDDRLRTRGTLSGLRAAMWAATTARASGCRTASCAPSSTGSSCSGCGAPTCCPRPRLTCAGSGARWATPTRWPSCWPRGARAPSVFGGCTSGCSTHRCSTRWPGSRRRS